MSSLQKLLGSELSEVLQRASHSIVEETVKNEPQNPLVSPKQQVLRLEEETNAAFEKLAQEYIEVGKLLVSTIELLSHTRTDINFEKISEEFSALHNCLNKETLELLGSQLLSNEPPANIVNLSDMTLNALFEACAHLFSEKKFQEATNAFSLLCNLAPNDYNNWVGYGHAAYNSCQYETAILAYYTATSLRPEIPWPLIWAANSCDKLNQNEAAVDLLTRANEVALESTEQEFQELARKIQERLSTLNIKY